MARSVEVPDCISSIEPKFVTIPMLPYSSNRILFPNEEALEEFKENSINVMHSFEGDLLTPPHILTFDFAGIDSMELSQTRVSLKFIFSHFRGHREENCIQTYSIFDGVSSKSTDVLCLWEKLGSTLQGRISEKPVIVARKQERTKYTLLGYREKVSRFIDLWRMLVEKKSWVNGKEFSKEHPSPTATITLCDLNDLHSNGLALHASYGKISYFRSIV